MEYLIKDRLHGLLLFLKYLSVLMECLSKEGGDFGLNYIDLQF